MMYEPVGIDTFEAAIVGSVDNAAVARDVADAEAVVCARLRARNRPQAAR